MGENMSMKRSVVKELWHAYGTLCTLLTLPLLSLMYALVNKPHGDVTSLVTALDRMIPFLPVFVIPYAVWVVYIYSCFLYFYFKDRKTYAVTLASYVICALVCYGIYFTFQTTVPRPEISGNGLFEIMVRFIYERDEPYNCFPSIHCFSSYLVMKAFWKSGLRTPGKLAFVSATSILIILSTLFIKQHVVVDALAAVLLVEIVYWTVSRLAVLANPAVESTVRIRA